MKYAHLLALIPLFLTPIEAYSIEFKSPINCEVGKTCFVISTPDLDATENSVYNGFCGNNTVDQQQGTFFALPNAAALAQDIEIIAVADGKVMAALDGAEDRIQSEVAANDVPDNKACGNAIMIEHEDGWVTRYCHLKKGSIIAQPGTIVEAGNPIALAGASGRTSHPGLAFAVFKNGQISDPFTTRTRMEQCGPAYASLWAKKETTLRGLQQTLAVLDMGATLAPVSVGDIKLSTDKLYMTTGKQESEDIYVWANLASLAKNDKVEVVLKNDKGLRLAGTEQIFQGKHLTLARIWRFPRSAALWSTGDYTAEITLTRTAHGKDYTKRAEAMVTIVK